MLQRMTRSQKEGESEVRDENRQCEDLYDMEKNIFINYAWIHEASTSAILTLTLIEFNEQACMRCEMAT